MGTAAVARPDSVNVTAIARATSEEQTAVPGGGPGVEQGVLQVRDLVAEAEALPITPLSRSCGLGGQVVLTYTPCLHRIGFALPATVGLCRRRRGGLHIIGCCFRSQRFCRDQRSIPFRGPVPMPPIKVRRASWRRRILRNRRRIRLQHFELVPARGIFPNGSASTRRLCWNERGDVFRDRCPRLRIRIDLAFGTEAFSGNGAASTASRDRRCNWQQFLRFAARRTPVGIVLDQQRWRSPRTGAAGILAASNGLTTQHWRMAWRPSSFPEWARVRTTG